MRYQEYTTASDSSIWYDLRPSQCSSVCPGKLNSLKCDGEENPDLRVQFTYLSVNVNCSTEEQNTSKISLRGRKKNYSMEIKKSILAETAYVITFLDSLCCGLTFPLLITRILVLGGSQAIVGVCISVQTLAQVASVPLINTLIRKYGERDTLYRTLLVSLATYYLLGVAEGYWRLIVIGCIYCLTNQTSYLCIQQIKENNLNSISTVHVCSVLGFITGTVAGGYLYELYDFWHVCLIATIFSFTSIVLIKCRNCILTEPMKEPKQPKSVSEEVLEKEKRKRKEFLVEAIIEEMVKDVSSVFSNIKISKCTLDGIFLIVSNFLFTVSTTIFFTKFPLLLTIQYGASSVIIGYTIAYQRMLGFVSNFVHATIKRRYVFQKIDYIVNIFFWLTVSFIGLCIAPLYEIYLACFIPMIFSKLIISDFWRDPFVITEKNRQNVCNIMNTLAKVTEILTPAVVGISFDYYGHYALQVLVIVPLIATLITLPFSESETASIEEKSKKKD